MTELEFHFYTGVEFSAPVSGHTFALHCLPVEGDAQKLQSYIIHIEPAAVCKQKLNTLLILLLPKNTWTGSVPVGTLPIHVFLGSVRHGKFVLFVLRLGCFRGLLRQRGAVLVRMEDGDTLL